MANKRFIFEGGNRSIYEEHSGGNGNIFTKSMEIAFGIGLLLLAYIILAPLISDFFSGIGELFSTTLVAGVIFLAFGTLAVLLIYLFFGMVSK